MNPHVRFDAPTRELARSAMVCAFYGWNDGGEAATTAARYLMDRWGASHLGSIDGEEFYDFQVNRPTVRLTGGVSRSIDWPRAELSDTGQGVVFLLAPEPSVRWRTFSEAVLDAAREVNAKLVVTLGGFLTDVPYRREVPVVGSARDEAEADRLRLAHSRYEGPTGIVGILHDAANRAGIQSVSLWAAVPHYLPISPNPKAALALVERATALLHADADTEALATAALQWEQGAARLIEDNEELAEYVHRLEEAAEEAETQDEAAGSTLLRHEPIPSGDAIAAELERFLQDQAGPDPGGEDRP